MLLTWCTKDCMQYGVPIQLPIGAEETFKGIIDLDDNESRSLL